MKKYIQIKNVSIFQNFTLMSMDICYFNILEGVLFLKTDIESTSFYKSTNLLADLVVDKQIWIIFNVILDSQKGPSLDDYNPWSLYLTQQF